MVAKISKLEVAINKSKYSKVEIQFDEFVNVST